MNIKCPIRKK